jgi:hypothetical protein
MVPRRLLTNSSKTERGAKSLLTPLAARAAPLALCAGLAATFTALAQSPATLICPEKVTVSEAITPVPGWRSTASQSEHAFERVSVYNGAAGGQEYELAPDDEKRTAGKIAQTWKLKDYRTMNVFLRCRYHNTSAVLVRDAPESLQTCIFDFALDKNGSFIGKSALVCR